MALSTSGRKRPVYLLANEVWDLWEKTLPTPGRLAGTPDDAIGGAVSHESPSARVPRRSRDPQSSAECDGRVHSSQAAALFLLPGARTCSRLALVRAASSRLAALVGPSAVRRQPCADLLDIHAGTPAMAAGIPAFADGCLCVLQGSGPGGRIDGGRACPGSELSAQISQQAPALRHPGSVCNASPAPSPGLWLSSGCRMSR